MNKTGAISTLELRTITLLALLKLKISHSVRIISAYDYQKFGYPFGWYIENWLSPDKLNLC